MITEQERTKNRETLEKFLVNKEIPKEFCVNDPNIMPYGFIYVIENLVNHKKYVGSTYSVWQGIKRPRPLVSMHKRATMYIYEYNKYSKTPNDAPRDIIKAMIEFGIENFIMYPVAETVRWNHIELETFFIDKFNTIKNGYNMNYPVNTRRLGGNSMSEIDKKTRSIPIVAINMQGQEIIFADSMKLFADFVGTSKDMIKNVTRKGMPYKGWFVFYLDKPKREHILVNNVINDQDKRLQDRHSEEAKKRYKRLYDEIDLFIIDRLIDRHFPGFKLLDNIVYNVE